MTDRYDELAQNALNDEPLSEAYARWILDGKEVELLPLVQAAFIPRRAHFGRRVGVQVLNNVQNGLCPEDCGYCAQSKTTEAPVREYPMKSDEEILKGAAEAAAIREKLAAEAAGLAEKAEAMKALDGAGREHEEFRIKLEQEREIAMAKIQARVQVSEAQARVMANAFDQAKINIVGGDGQFFDRFLKAVSLGHAVDGFMDASTTAQTALGEYQDGSRSLPNDLTEILSRPAIGPEGIKDLSLVALIKKLMDGAGPMTW